MSAPLAEEVAREKAEEYVVVKPEFLTGSCERYTVEVGGLEIFGGYESQAKQLAEACRKRLTIFLTAALRAHADEAYERGKKDGRHEANSQPIGSIHYDG